MSAQTKPFFTVVIPTYNRAGFIGLAIESVLAQTYPSFEVIVVDDGSTDNTAAVVGAIQDPRVKYVPKRNEERAVARNTGAERGTGDYVTFFDSDDILYPNHLAEAVKAISELNSPEVFHLGFDFKTPDGTVTRQVKDLAPQVNDLLIRDNVLSCNGVFVRSDVAKQYKFNPDRALSAVEDWELWLRLAARFPIHHRPVITSTVVDHDARSVVMTKVEPLVRRQELLVHYLQQDQEFMRVYGSRLPLLKANVCTYIALHLALTKQHRGQTLKYLLRGVAASPSVLTQRRFYATLKHWA
jgi:glycosyltransferase involved in cell wall biosynthesis